MRKCLHAWVNGSYNFHSKLSGRDIELMSKMLDDANTTKPVEIHRCIRKINCLKFWKGVEYRTFLLYLGPVILKDFLAPEVYLNFITFFCAVTIVSCKEYLQFIHLSEQLFKDYIEQFIHIYGIDAVSSNVHNLIHITDEVKRFGNLTEISSYKFENFLGYLKSLLRGGSRPLAQIAKRVIELSKVNNIVDINNRKSSNISYPYVKNQLLNITHGSCNKLYSKIYLTNGFLLSTSAKNKWFMTNDKHIIAMKYAFCINEKFSIFGDIIKHKYDFFELPIKSSYLNIYVSDGSFAACSLFELRDIKCKLVSMKYHNQIVFFPLLHTFDLVQKLRNSLICNS